MKTYQFYFSDGTIHKEIAESVDQGFLKAEQVQADGVELKFWEQNDEPTHKWNGTKFVKI